MPIGKLKDVKFHKIGSSFKDGQNLPAAEILNLTLKDMNQL
jgi:hypothetical protein